MASNYAICTLLTNDAYLPGAIALVAALRDLHTRPAQAPEVDFQTVCIVTPETVDVSSIKLLRRTFDLVVGVEIIEQEDTRNLQLLGRPDLSQVLTKLHVLRLTQYTKILFLDADVLPLRPLSHLLALPHDFSAAPDVGWPDIFNSGVMVLTPSDSSFEELRGLLKTRGSWDGGDQGLLNEWRGDNWHRLSFTYNTTPTAAYTYAPAYERFGSTISAIHFIGSNKPWLSIPYRAPGSEGFRKQVEERQHVYDYNSLVDRWFAVYDKHYRSAPPTPSPLNFEVARYDAVWDEGTNVGAEVVPSAALPAAVGSNWASSLGSARLQSRPGVGGYPLQVQASGPLSLDDLRRMAVEGADGIFLGTNAMKQEGEYRRLPLDGRIDLMRQKRESPPPHLEDELESGERTPQQESFPPGESHHASGHVETATGRSAHRRRHQRAREHQPNHDSSDSGMEGNWLDQPPFPGHKRSRSSPPRPLSPPKITWDPAVDPPPNVPPPASAFPSETYFANAWDRPQGRASDVTYQAFTLSGGEPREPFFHIPPPSAIPEALLQQGAYNNVVHGERVPQPDPSKVKAVFPWEEQPRHAPTRAFPKSESPPHDTIYLGDELPAASATAKPGARPVMHKSLSSSLHSPSGISFTNAWDTVPSIKKYATKLARPENAPVPRVPSFDDAEYQRSRELHDRLDALSREADDEDDGDEEESDEERGSRARSRSTETGRPAYADHEEGTQVSEYMRPALKSRPTSRARIRSGSGSPIITPFIVKKEYQSQAVSPPLAHASPALAAPSRHGHGRTQSASVTRPPSDVRRTSFSNRLPTHRQGSSEDVRGRTESLPMRRDRTPLSLKRTAPAPDSSLATPLLLRSHPRKTSSGQGSPLSHSSPSSSSAETPPRRHQLGTVTTGVGLGLGTPPGSLEFPGRIEREVSGGSAETGMTSPLRTPSTPFGEFDPIGLVAGQKASRNWNPNTGVDVFKRGSEEVLARFLRQGSWEDDSSSRSHSPLQQRP